MTRVGGMADALVDPATGDARSTPGSSPGPSIERRIKTADRLVPPPARVASQDQSDCSTHHPLPIDAGEMTLNQVLALVGWRSDPISPGSGRKLVFDEAGEPVRVGGYLSMRAGHVWDELRRRGLIR